MCVSFERCNKGLCWKEAVWWQVGHQGAIHPEAHHGHCSSKARNERKWNNGKNNAQDEWNNLQLKLQKGSQDLQLQHMKSWPRQCWKAFAATQQPMSSSSTIWIVEEACFEGVSAGCFIPWVAIDRKYWILIILISVVPIQSNLNAYLHETTNRPELHQLTLLTSFRMDWLIDLSLSVRARLLTLILQWLPRSEHHMPIWIPELISTTQIVMTVVAQSMLYLTQTQEPWPRGLRATSTMKASHHYVVESELIYLLSIMTVYGYDYGHLQH